jgi:hypothetical protein
MFGYNPQAYAQYAAANLGGAAGASYTASPVAYQQQQQQQQQAGQQAAAGGGGAGQQQSAGGGGGAGGGGQQNAAHLQQLGTAATAYAYVFGRSINQSYISLFHHVLPKH